MRTPVERKFLEILADQPQGRCAFRPIKFEEARREFQGLIDDGLIKERRLGLNPGFQILPAGRAFLNPIGDE